MNYLYGNCLVTIEGDDYLYPVVPFSYWMEPIKNTAYLKDGYLYIYRGDIIKQKRFASGLFTSGEKFIFALAEEDKDKYVWDNIKDDSIHTIVAEAKKINPNLKRKIMRDITKSSDIYMPELDENDDFLKHLVKLMLQEKRIDLKDHKDKFKKSHTMTNAKASLETKTSPDGKKGSLTINNLLKWMEVLDMDIEVIFRDNPASEDPCFKVFKYSAENGFSVENADGYEEVNQEEFDEEDED